MMKALDPIGRVIPILLKAPFTPADVGELADGIRRGIHAVGGPVVIAGDLRGYEVAEQEVGDALIQLMKADNAHIEAAAHLISDDVFVGLQAKRLLSAAESDRRRHFDDLEALMGWLQERINPVEAAAVRRFYDA